VKAFSSGIFQALIILLTVGSTLAQPEEIDLPEQSPAERSVKLEELWSLGGEDDEDVLLGVVNTGVLDAEGNVYLLDAQLTQVLVINPEGRQIGTLGREGDGPGELTRPIALFLNGQNQLGIVQSFPGRIVLLNLDDTPAGTIHVGGDSRDGGLAFITQAQWRDGNLVINSGKGAFDTESGKFTTNLTLGLVDDNGIETARFAHFSQERNLLKQVFDEEADFSELGTWALGPDCVYTVPQRAAYLINKKNLDGELVSVLRRPVKARKRSEKEKEEVNATMRAALQGRMEIEEHVLDHDPVIAALHVADDGRLFVQHSLQVPKHLPEGIASRFDIIDSDGVYLEELTLELPGFDPDQDSLVFLEGTHFLHIRNIQGTAMNMVNGLLGQNRLGDESEEVGALEIIFCRMAE
jgi:hypothetical protein